MKLLFLFRDNLKETWCGVKKKDEDSLVASGGKPAQPSDAQTSINIPARMTHRDISDMVIRNIYQHPFLRSLHKLLHLLPFFKKNFFLLSYQELSMCNSQQKPPTPTNNHVRINVIHHGLQVQTRRGRIHRDGYQ